MSTGVNEIPEIPENCTIVDTHVDIAVAIAEWRLRGETKVIENRYLPIAQKGCITAWVTGSGGDSPFFATYPTRAIWPPRDELHRHIITVDAVLSDIKESPDKLILAKKANDIRKAKKEGKVAIILDLEGCRPLGHDLAILRMLYTMGERVLQPVHNYRNYFADGCNVRNPSGLTSLGIDLVKECNRLGMLIDISHLSDKGILDVLEFSKDPIVNSHTCCKAFVDNPRNMTDEYMKMIAEKGGTINLTSINAYISKENADFEGFMKHIDHAVEICGIDHVGIGTDISDELPRDILTGIWGKWPRQPVPSSHPEGLRHGSEIINVIKALENRGYSESDVRKIMGDNFIKVFGRVCG